MYPALQFVLTGTVTGNTNNGGCISGKFIITPKQFSNILSRSHEEHHIKKAYSFGRRRPNVKNIVKKNQKLLIVLSIKFISFLRASLL